MTPDREQRIQKEMEKIKDEIRPTVHPSMMGIFELQPTMSNILLRLAAERTVERDELRVVIPQGNHPEDFCQECDRENVLWFASNALYNAVNGSSSGIFCPQCFEKKAQKEKISIVFYATTDSSIDNTLSSLESQVKRLTIERDEAMEKLSKLTNKTDS